MYLAIFKYKLINFVIIPAFGEINGKLLNIDCGFLNNEAVNYDLIQRVYGYFAQGNFQAGIF